MSVEDSVFATTEIQEILRQGIYRPIPLSSIRFKSRPHSAKERGDALFFNARSVSGFDDESMRELEDSIADLGLSQPIGVRCTNDHDYEIVWGERRTRAIMSLVEKNRDVWDDEAGDLRPASEVYQTIFSRVLDKCDDERAIRLAFAENVERVALPDADVIDLCEHLETKGYNRKEIGALLNKQPSWISHTFNFKVKLPVQVYEMLRSGLISRDYAIRIMEQPKEMREDLSAMALQIAEERYTEELHEVETELEEIDEDLSEAETDVVLSDADTPDVQQRHRRRLERVQKQADAVILKEEAVKKKGVVHKPGDVDEAAKRKGLRTRKGLTTKAIHTQYIERVQTLNSDQAHGKRFQARDLEIVKVTAVGIAQGEKDLASILSKHYDEKGYWTEEINTEEEIDDEANGLNDDIDEDIDEDEDDEIDDIDDDEDDDIDDLEGMDLDD